MECKYHVVWIPKYRRKKLFGEVRRELGPILRELAKHKESEIMEGKMMVDHIHMLISIPPKYAISQVIGYIKGKSAIHIARTFGGRQKNFTGEHFWARGYYVSTVGIDEAALRRYMQQQEDLDFCDTRAKKKPHSVSSRTLTTQKSQPKSERVLQ
jgi:putative transposase